MTLWSVKTSNSSGFCDADMSYGEYTLRKSRGENGRKTDETSLLATKRSDNTGFPIEMVVEFIRKVVFAGTAADFLELSPCSWIIQ